MGILSKIFSSGTSELVKEVGGVIDNLTTTQEEKLQAEQKIKELFMAHEAEIQKQVTERWRSDMNSDSWMSKNVRPMVLIFLVFSTILLIFIDGGLLNFKVENSWIELIKLTLLTVIGSYFGGRSYEKVKKSK
jgi:hypothetical protein